MDDYSLVPVEHQPDFENVSLVPVDHDPFSVDGVTQQAPSQLARSQPAQPPPQQPATGVDRLYVGPAAKNTQASEAGESWEPDAGNSDTSTLDRTAVSTPAQNAPAYDRSHFQPFGELKPATSTPTQKIGYLAADGLMAAGMQPYTANNLTKRIGALLGLTPLGVAGSALDLIDAKRRDDLPGAAAAAIGLIPGARGIARGIAEDAGAGLRTLYHYTNEVGLNAILKEGKLNPSLKALRPRDVRYGNGQYLTDIEPGTISPEKLSMALVQNKHQAKKFTHYLEIDPTDLNVVEGRPGVHVIPNEVPLDLNNRIISSGKVPDK